MPNTFLNPNVIAEAALATLYENTVMAQLAHRDYSSEFTAKVGDTVNVRKPAVFEAKEFDPVSGIEIQSATETTVAVVLNHHADTSFEVTSKDMTLKIDDFAEQLLNPALESIAQKIDKDTLDTLIAGTTAEVGTGNYGDPAVPLWTRPEVLIQAGTVLNINKVPTNDRFAVVGPTTNGKWLDTDQLKRVDESGSTEALREAYLGRRLFGFSPYWTQHVEQPAGTPASGEPTTEVGVAFHKTAVALVTRPFELPQGAANAVVMNYKGFGIRVVIAYDNVKKKDVVSVDTLYGVKVLDPNRAVLLKGADAA